MKPSLGLAAVLLLQAGASFGFVLLAESREPGSGGIPMHGLFSLAALLPLGVVFLLSRKPGRSGVTLALWAMGLLAVSLTAAALLGASLG
ncbi:hypothetical protein [Leucobacter sp. M11]|uniref:hypothetical protein n=1 Tax=Leucobacter sp. M11 TaxID=2993565 RepID=UPI002D7F5139|nr:hypothetical protein [Leucobacter sp. M11]MEB4616291.1 hypothetical protein [Leucobacter sp. M11]